MNFFVLPRYFVLTAGKTMRYVILPAVTGVMFLIGQTPVWADMIPMDEVSLSEAQGQNGITLGMEFDANIKPPTETPTADSLDNSTAITGQPSLITDSPFNSCSGNGNACTWAMQFANRPNQWLVFKDYYASLRIYSLNLDGVQLSTVDNGSSSYFDAAKFKSSNGATCLLPTGSCTVADVKNLYALAFSYPTRTEKYDPVSLTSTGYNSVQLYLNIGRMAVQFDDQTVAGLGYLAGQDTGQSFLGITVSDNMNKYAGMAIHGKAYVYGF